MYPVAAISLIFSVSLIGCYLLASALGAFDSDEVAIRSLAANRFQPGKMT